MVMILQFIILAFHVLAVRIARFKFGSNFGEIFYDYSGYMNHGQNGESIYNKNQDTIPTDRGVYFVNEAYITLPPNEINPSPIDLGVTFSIVQWIKPYDNSGGILGFISIDDTEFISFAIQSTTTKLTGFSSRSINKLAADCSSCTINNQKWNFIVLINEEPQMKLYLNGENVITIPNMPSFTSIYPINYYIGYTSESFKGFMWNFYLHNSLVNLFEYYGPSHTVGSCEIPNCPPSCSPSIRENTEFFCLSEQNFYDTDGTGIGCGTCPYGCNNETCLDCDSCEIKTCFIKSKAVKCLCNNGITTSTKCTCSDGMYYSSLEIKCKTCYQECLTCNSEFTCLTCIDPNAFPYSNFGCACKDGYFNSTLLSTVGSCKKCYSDCLSCEQDLVCLTCVDSNAVPDSLEGCKCKTQFFNVSSLDVVNSCVSCYDECESCKEDFKCAECISKNSKIDENKGCVCIDGFYNTTRLLNTNSCIACYESCETCNNALVCVTCKDSNATASAFGCICNVGYYNFSSLESGGTCFRCEGGCSECTYNNCISCIDANAEINEGIECVCKLGFYNETSLYGGGVCLSCFNECKSCNEALMCTECIADYASPQSIYGCECDVGYYNTSSLTNQAACLECHIECKSCSKKDICEECVDSKAVPQLNKGCLCLPGFYNSSQIIAEGECKPCNIECKTCSTEFSCDECVDPNAILLQNGQCTCSDGFYLSKESICKPCLVECKTCTKASECSDCLDINSNPHSNKGCLCSEGYYNTTSLSLGGSCLPCVLPCTTCKSEKFCKKCMDPNSSPQRNSGECECNEGYYQSNNSSSNLTCSPCFNECKKCSENSICEECFDSNAYVHLNGGCLCNQSFYNDSQILSNGICKRCDSDCVICTTNNKCLLCVDPHAAPTMSKGCECKEGFYKSNNSSCLKYFYASLSISSKNYVQISFTEPISAALSLKDFEFLVVNRTDFQVMFLKGNASSYYLFSLLFENKIESGTALTVILNKQVYSKLGSLLKDRIFNKPLSGFTPISIPGDLKAVLNSSTATTKAAVSGSIAVAMLSNPSVAWTVINTIQILQYLPLSSVPMTENLRDYFITLTGYNYLPNIMEFVFSKGSSEPPYQEARKCGIQSSVFFVNIGQNFLILFVAVAGWPFIFGLNRIASGKLKARTRRILDNYVFGFFLRYWVQVYLDLGIFAIIQLRAKIIDETEGRFNQIIATISIVTSKQISVSLCPFILGLSSYHNILSIVKTNETFTKKWGTFFTEFKNNKGFWSTQFYFIYLIRRLILIFSLTYLNSFLYVQGALSILTSLISLLFLLIFRPFKNSPILISTIFGEICLSLVTILVYSYMLDLGEKIGEFIEKLIIYIIAGTILAQSIVSIFIFCGCVKVLWVKYEKYRIESFIKSASAIYSQNTSNDVSFNS